MSKPFYADLGDIEEDKRIELIGAAVTEHKKTVAFITESDRGKADRYIKKLIARFPGVEIMDQKPGPIANTVTVRVRPKAFGIGSVERN